MKSHAPTSAEREAHNAYEEWQHVVPVGDRTPRNIWMGGYHAARAAMQTAEPVACGACYGSGWVVRDPDIGTDQECFSCGGSGVDEDATPAAALQPVARQDEAGAQPVLYLRAIDLPHPIGGKAIVYDSPDGEWNVPLYLTPAIEPVAGLTDASRDVLAERVRQITVEGRTPEGDDEYTACELARAAATYAVCSHVEQLQICGVRVWPWHIDWFKRTTYRRDLVKAGALLLAEIERLDRDRAAIESRRTTGNAGAAGESK